MSDIKEAVFPSAPLTERIGLIALYLFLFFAWESKGRASLMLGFVVLACLLDRRFWRALRYSAIAWATGILGLYILMRGGIAILSEPEYSQYHSDAIVRLLLLGLFPAIGWLLGGDQRRILVALAVALAGLLTGCLEHYNWSITSTLPWYQIRQQFGFNSANVFGVLAAMATLGLVVLAPRFWSGTKRAVKWLGVLVWSLLLLLAVQGLAVSQSRSALLALILTATGIVVFNWRTLLRRNMATIITALMIIAILVSSVGYLNRDGVMRRLLDEPDTYAKILTGRIDQVEAVYANGVPRSAGIRVHLTRFGLAHWKENPLFGLGPGATKPLIRDKWTTGNMAIAIRIIPMSNCCSAWGSQAPP